MAESLSQPPILTETLVGAKKKSRRGQRANKKPNPISVEKLLATAVSKLEVQPKKRQPRRPKIPGNEGDKSRENDSVSKTGSVEESAASAIAQSLVEIITEDPAPKTEHKLRPLEPKQKKKRGRNDQEKKEKARNELDNSEPNGGASPRRGIGIWSRNEESKSSNRTHRQNGMDKNKFDEYIPEKIIRKLLSTQKDYPEYVEGNIRINPKFFKEAYIAMPNNEADLLIDGVQDRNRALEGDLVVVRINPKEQWRGLRSAKPQKTATVVCILEKVHPRRVVGFLKTMPDNNRQVALFCPRDHKVPRLNIDAVHWPPNFYQDPESFAKTMFLAEITSWNDVRFARGRIVTAIGQVGDIKAESTAILMENDLDVTPYGEELTRNLPPSDYQPTIADINGREDWRKECIFTIDPITAQDLDDAMSCKPLENGNFEVGVHISDVTHYLELDSPLDLAVSKRATTIYMTDSVYHMLPKQLCNVCSLLPGSDKLAFSVIFEMTPEGEVVKHRFAKTVINSCCQFAYEHAQMMIMNPEKEWGDDEVPQITGPYKISQLSTVVNNLNNLAVKMRERRLINGSLRIDQPKLYVSIDRESGLPISFTLEEQKDSNRLIEEFMLLANMTTATHLYKNLPDVAFLRHHQQPQMRILTETQSMLEKLGIHIDIESAGALQASLLRYQPNPEANSNDLYLATCRSKVLNALCSKTMMRAKYFCTSANLDDIYLRHYALNAPLYTHFTSPIRRYADCVVHRLLYASITNALPVPNWTPKRCGSIAANCNKQKYNAKRAQELSSEFYLTTYLGLVGPISSTAIAIDVKDRSVDVIICDMGITLRIYTAEIEKHGAAVSHQKHDEVQTITIVWKKSQATQVINIFSIMNIRVGKHPEFNRLHGELIEPEQGGF